MNELVKFEELIDRFFKDNTKEQIRLILKKYDNMKFEGVDVSTYLESLSNELYFSEFIFDPLTNQKNPDFIDFWVEEVFTFQSENISFICQPQKIEINTNCSTRYSSEDNTNRIAA
ncbi:MAG: hypothetical protein WA816_08880 [Bacteroidales bacterium]